MRICTCGHDEQPDVEGALFSYGVCVCDEDEDEFKMWLMEPKLTAEQVAEAERLRQIMLDTVDEYKRKHEAAK